MGCSTCSTENGSQPGGIPAGCGSNGSCGTESGCNKLEVFDWLANLELPSSQPAFDIMEIRFKNSRKEFFKNVNNLSVNVGDIVAVEASPGHDIGVVSLTGELVRLQMKKRAVDLSSEEIKKLYRKAKPADIEKWQEAQKLERETMYRARTIATKLNLQMKISDVEYQGDKTKAVFYYTAEERVDFRELIKVLAEEFKVRVEMRQIGSRQEASRLGGIGSCGRELCCSTWLTDFRSVSTGAARYQQLSLNPMKLAGQCGKLKCCLNYELDSYMDAIKDFPDVSNVKLETEKGRAFHQKTDIFKRTMFFSYTSEPDNFISLTVDRVKEIIDMNKNGAKPTELMEKLTFEKPKEKVLDYENVVGQDSLTRFDKDKKRKKKKPKKHFSDRKPTTINNP
jgi:cell fate regulator YaaT (PSP1 superfamily)